MQKLFIREFSVLKQLSIRQKVGLISILFSLITLPIAFFLSQSDQDVEINAIEIDNRVVRGKSGDRWADLVLGKIDFNQAGPNEVTPFKVNNPGGTIVDRSVTPNRI